MPRTLLALCIASRLLLLTACPLTYGENRVGVKLKKCVFVLNHIRVFNSWSCAVAGGVDPFCE